MATFLSRINSIKVPDYFAVAIARVVWGTAPLSYRLPK